MSFLWPMAWALGLLALPVIAFYLIRTRLERKPVSAFLFWEHLTTQVYNASLWRRLRRWVSLALQLLFLLLLIFAISQPLASWQSAKPASIIVVLDASVSMTAADVPPNRWSEAVKIAQRRIAQMRFFDEALLIEAGETPRVLRGWSRNKRALGRALLTAKPSANTCDIRPALTLAHHLADQRKEHEIVLISDGVWDEPPAETAMAGVQTRLVGKTPVNIGISLFTARRSPATPGEYQVIARVVGTGAASAELELRRNGALIDVQPIQLEPGKPWQRTWDGSGSENIRFEAKVSITGATGSTADTDANANARSNTNANTPRDDLAADNRATARLGALRPVPIEVVAPPQPFLAAALDSLPLAALHRTWPVSDLQKKLESGTLSAADANKLYIFHHAVPPPGFHPRAMLVIEPEGDGFWGKSNGILESALVSESQKDEPIMRFVSFDNVRLQKATDFTPAPGATVFAESFGKPLIFGRWNPGRNGNGGAAAILTDPQWLVLSFGLEDSDLVFRTAFPILIGNLVQSLQPDETDGAGMLPGAVESRLASTLPAPPDAAAGQGATQAQAHASLSWWSGFPFWWWALLIGLGWLLLEWWLYSRRITE